MEITPIAEIFTDFPSKFGIPRQSGRVSELTGTIIFGKEYRNDEALRGIEQFSHLWLIWGFSESAEKGEKNRSFTVRPPRLGGNKRIGVFASRSPFRPNSLGLSCVKLIGIEKSEKYSTVLKVSGVDMMSGTPIYDIKPYIPYADRIDGAIGGYADENRNFKTKTEIPQELLNKLPKNKRTALRAVLEDDPRPAYRNGAGGDYGFLFAGYEIKFRADNDKITVTNIEKL